MRTFDMIPDIMKPIIQKQCSIIGVDHKTIDYGAPFWFHTHSWSQKQRNKFRKWLIQYLHSHPDTVLKLTGFKYKNRKYLSKTADAIIFQWGWKDKEVSE